MKTKILLFGLLFILASTSQATVHTISSSSTWSNFISGKTFANGDEIVINAGVSLIISGVCDDLDGYDLVYSVYGTINFGTNGSSADEFWLSSNSLIRLFNNGQVAAVTCVGQKRIYFGGTLVATCSGGITGGSAGTTYASFNDINTAGGIGSGGPVPVKWIDYSATDIGAGYIEVQWTTASEIDNSHFEIEFSTDNANWIPVGTVYSLAEGGNSNEVLDYSFMHNTDMGSHGYYRVKQTDFNGTYDYTESMIVEVLDGELFKVMTLGSGAFKVQINDNSYGSSASFNIYNMQGKLIESKMAEEEATFNTGQPGAYLIEVISNNRTEVVKQLIF